MINLGMLMPFLGAISNPDRIYEINILRPLYNIFAISDSKQVPLFLLLVFVIFSIASAFFRILLLNLNAKFSFLVGADLSMRVYSRVLFQPYKIHIERNSSEVLDVIAIKVNDVIYGILTPVLNLLSSFVILIIIVIGLLIISPYVTLAILISISALYFFLIIFTRQQLIVSSKVISYQSNRVIKLLQEGLGGIRDILLDGNQQFYLNAYHDADLALRRAQAHALIVGQSPKLYMETLGLLVMCIVGYTLSQQNEDLSYAIPLLGTIALGMQRLLPLAQQAYNSFTNILSTKETLGDVIGLLNQSNSGEEMFYENVRPINFTDSIALKNIFYKYSEGLKWVLQDLNLEIKKGSIIGIIGVTGSGKSTLIDVLMGLLEPQKGCIEIDGTKIDSKNIRSWQGQIGHVPQFIYLADISIAENIAFGIPAQKIDFERVKEAATMAKLHDFIESLPLKYQSPMGERGVRLSGGQRQRIGIARALYKNSGILLLDEATSALDDETEKQVMDCISDLAKVMTILIITHRLSTLKACSSIYRINQGLLSQASYGDLIVK
jgi:ATP-binding cassette subfamily B protein